jgi:riboflavin synthase
VDGVVTCTGIKEKKGSFEYRFSLSRKFAPLIIEKGSVCINGISLTAFNVKKKSFTVALIPYTMEHTNMGMVKVNDKVNIEYDLIGKYLLRTLSLSKDFKKVP